jgi:putative ABC transport system permease protein
MRANWRDLKYTIRGLRRSPGFTAAVVFALALGIGLNAVIFSVIHAVLLNPPSFRKLRDPERLVMIWERNLSMSAFFAERLPVRSRNFQAWKEQARSFEDLAVWSDTSLTLTASEDRSGRRPEQVETGIASANFFLLLGVRLQMGRNFSAEEMQAAILSDELYKSRFGNDSKILEKFLTANGKQYRIIGVLPPDFELPSFREGLDQKKPKLWIPVDLHPPAELDEGLQYFVFGRLKPGVRISEARRGNEGDRKEAEHRASRHRYRFQRQHLFDGCGKRRSRPAPRIAGVAGGCGVRAADCLRERREPGADARA